MVDLPPGATLIFYTDGLVERRGEALDTGLARLAELVAAGGGLECEELADLLVSRLLTDEAVKDDAAVVIARALPRPVLSRRAPAQPEVLRELRAELRAWLEQEHVEQETAGDLVLACGEALGNAVEHAYAGNGRANGPPEVELLGERRGNMLRLVVRDAGCWRPRRRATGRGRGLSIIKALADAVDIATGDTGTTVTIEKNVARTASPDGDR